ncbi:MAG: hypothetical protein Q9226_001420 [Calogaya cf. arnoldii]
MGKRRRGSDDGSPHEKRRRLTTTSSSKTSTENVTSVKQLQNLLAFNQDAGPNTRQNFHTFKLFLESIAYGDDAELQLSQRAILLQYLSPQPAAKADRQHPDPSDLFKAWSFATQSNNESLYSSITAVLALLLKTISHHVDFRAAGRDLCNLFLEKDNLKLLERGLSAEKSKDHVISPCLRLLTQLVSFDGGFAAKRLYRNKDVTLKRLDTFLTLRPDSKAADIKSRRKIPVRNVALQYLFANLRLQDHAIKTEILAHGRLSRSLFHDMKDDSPTVIRETLQVMLDDVLKDEKIPYRAKGRLFTDQVLSSIASLYSYPDNTDIKDDEDNPRKQDIPELAHAFLLSLCTTPQYGILLRPGGQSSESSLPIETEKRHESGPPSKRIHKRAAVQNSTLSSFLQTLRPYANILQRDLTLATFQAAPELISDYFHKKKAFSFEPKLTATWLGFAAFLLSTIQLPLHQSMVNARGTIGPAPAIADIIESILPLPLSSKVVSRCLNQNTTVIKFFAVKIMIAAFYKLAQTIRYFRSRAATVRVHLKQTWELAASELRDEFSQRCPDMNHVISVFRSCSSHDSLLRESGARLLSLYYHHLPQVALEQKFDASVALSAMFDKLSLSDPRATKPSVESMVLTHLLDIGRCSPDMRWWQKSEHNQLSLFGKGLRLCTKFSQDIRSRSLEALLQSVVGEAIGLDAALKNRLLAFLLRSLVQSGRAGLSEDANCLPCSSPSRQNYFLRDPVNRKRSPSQGRSRSRDPKEVYTSADDNEWQPSDALFEFLDSCLIRLARKTVKYNQDLLSLRGEARHTAAPDADIVAGYFLMVVLEQWPFIQTSTTLPDVVNISHWLTRFLLIVARNCGNLEFIDCVRDKVESLTTLQRCRVWLKKAPDVRFVDVIDFQIAQPPNDEASTLGTWVDETILGEEDAKEGWQAPTPPASEGEDHPGLGKLKQLGIEEAIVEGAVGEVMLCLCSQYADIRKQALMELRKWMKALQMSQYSEREAVYLLVGEVVETCKSSIGDSRLAGFAGVIAAECCLVLSNPLHVLYAKVNRFLNRGPVWKVEKLPSYWVEQIVMRLPSMDDGYYKEIEWLLDVLREGLRTSADMELYRRSHILERLLSLLASPSLPPRHKEMILALLYRYNHVGGSTTLITRCSLLSWIPSYLALSHTSEGQITSLGRLMERCKMDCDRERVHEWSGGKLCDVSPNKTRSPLAQALSSSSVKYLTSCQHLFADSPPAQLSTYFSTTSPANRPSMAQRYTRAELEHLRASPLVAKPASLPPTEEWMGPLPDPTQKKLSHRGKNDEPPPNEGNNRRPIFERHMSRGSTNLPEDIVLGPPKTAFASAAGARNQGRTFDAATRPSFGAQGDEAARGDRQNFRDKLARQGARNDLDAEASQESRSGAQQHRRGTNDNESWSGRQSRILAQDEGDRGARRNGYREQDKDNSHEARTPRAFDPHRRDATNNETNDTRRNGQGRGRNEPSWYRDEKDAEATDGKRDNNKTRDWRDKSKGNTWEGETDWKRGPRQEVDPEWMDEPDVHEKKQTHTQEDFERWKERMKAGNGPSQENPPPTSQQRPNPERVVSGLASPPAKVKVGTPLVVDPSIDGFFGLWNDSSKKESSTEEGAQHAKTEASKPKTAKSSKFTGFFGSKAVPAEQETRAPVMSPLAAPADSSSEDKEGFQRILKLLDQQQTNPAKDGTAREQFLRNMPASPVGRPQQQQRGSTNLQDLLSPRSKNGGPVPPNKDSEFLLNLMRQSRSQPNTGEQRSSNPVATDLLPFSNLLISPQQATGPGLPPGLSGMTGRQDGQSHDKLNPTSTPDRKGLPPGLFDPRPNAHESVRMGKEGLEYAPSFLSQHVPLPQSQRQPMMPPPGFQAPLRNPTQFPPGLPSSMLPAGQDRGNPFAMRMNGGNGLPGMPGMPSPGFTNAPPPGFAPMPMNQDNNASRMYFGVPLRPQPGEGYGEAGDFGLRGGQFRRQE